MVPLFAATRFRSRLAKLRRGVTSASSASASSIAVAVGGGNVGEGLVCDGGMSARLDNDGGGLGVGKVLLKNASVFDRSSSSCSV